MQDTNLLVWLPSPMGDAILCTPALRAIREHFDSGKITFFANSVVRQVLSPCSYNDAWLEQKKNNPFAISKELKKHKFTHAILFKNSFASALAAYLAQIPSRTGYVREKRGFLLTGKLYPAKLPNGKYKALSMVDYYLAIASGLGAQINDRNLELSIDPSAKESLRVKLPELFNTDVPIVIFVPGGAFGPSKCWPSNRFAQTADRLIAEYNATVVISVATNPAEQKIAQNICRSSKYFAQSQQQDSKRKIISLAENPLSLGGLKALYAMADMVIANDTGPRHIAVALGRKVVTLFGPNNPAWTDTNYENEIQIIGNVHCAPCHNPICPKNKHFCMESITVEVVCNAAKQLLENKRKQAKIYTRQEFAEISEFFFIDPAYKSAFDTLGLDSINAVFSFDTAKNLKKKNLARFRSRLQFEIKLSDTSEPLTLFLKRYDNPPIRIQLKNWLATHGRKSCASVEFEASQRLTEAGINTPKTIAYGTQTAAIFEKRSFVITEKIPDAEALERKLPDFFNGPVTVKNLKLRRSFISQLADFIKKFHETNYRHRDLYLSHIFYNDNGSFYLIDLARVFKPFVFKLRYQIKDIAQMYYSSPGKVFSRTDRMRFYLHYASRQKLTTEDKIFIKKVLNKAKQMAIHDARHSRTAPFKS
ncbi:MAG: lipopolysaccharide heptosyltransferase II [Sedimentisphaerales bacterium]|nr:lipopolysaccharide heptosyltransferase II [Sedimentisphaerales bacterium]